MKKCVNCKHVHKPYESSVCRRCDVTDPNVHLGRVKHTKWEPKDEEPDCEKCKHEDKDPEAEPCQECGIDGENYFEPKDAEKLCKNCGVKSIEDQMMVCTHCYDHSKWRPKEEKKMADSRKTKAQLMEELEQKNNEIAELKKELKKSESYEQCVEAGKALRETIDGLVEGGLTEEQAMQFLIGVAPMAFKLAR